MHLSVERTYVTHVTIDVPPEVLDNIFQRLRTRDIKSVRLVCGSFNVAASRYLVDRIYLSSSTRDLNTIDAISKHATFSKCVTQVVFDCRIYEERIATDRRRYSRAVRRRPFEADSLVWTRTMVDDSYEKYVERYRQQQECFRTDSDTRCLLTALPLLPRLTEVTFTGDRCEKLWPRTASHCGPLTDRTDEVVVVQPSVEASYTMDTMTADEMESHQQICHSRILHMLRTLAASPLTGRLRSFKLGNSFPGTFALSYKIFDADVEYAGNLEILFRHLRKLHLVISAGPIQHPRQNLSSNIRIGKILTRAEKLEALSLSLNSYSSDRADSVNLTQLIGCLNFPFLRSFTLANMTCTSPSLVAFVESHGCTLKRITLENVHLKGSKSAEMLDVFRDLNLKLDYCDIHTPHDRYSAAIFRNELILQYLREGGQNPLKEDV